MSVKNSLQLFTVLGLLLCNLACSPMMSGSNSFGAASNNFSANPNTGRNYDAIAVAEDGRQVYLINGTWEFAPSGVYGGREVRATLPDGRRVWLHPNGTWSFANFTYNAGDYGLRHKTPKRKAPPKPSTLYIYQDDGGFGRATVYLDGAPIAHLRENRYFAINIPAGKHSLSIAKPDQGTVNLTTAPGRRYYIKNCECFDGWGERLKLMGVNEAENEIAKSKLIKSADVIRYELFLEPKMSN